MSPWELFHCAGCDVLFVHPHPPEIESIYQGDYHSWMTGGSRARLRTLLEEARARQLLDFLSGVAQPPGRLLDVGCSAGFFLSAAKARGWSAEGLEINPGTAAHAAQSTGCRVYNVPLEDIGDEARGYDVITAWDVLEHLRDPSRLLVEAAPAWAPGACC